MNKKEKKKHLIHLAFWTWSWVLTLAIATFGPEFFWEEKSALTIVAIVVNLPIGILMVLANRKLFNHYDELERKIHLESMGVNPWACSDYRTYLFLIGSKKSNPF